MALLNSQVLRTSRGGAPLLPMAAQPQSVALRPGSSNILMAGQNVAVHSCANGGGCACSGSGCSGATAMKTLTKTSALLDASTAQQARNSQVGRYYEPSLPQGRKLNGQIESVRPYEGVSAGQRVQVKFDPLQVDAVNKAIAAQCPSKCASIQCGSPLPITWSYRDPLSKRMVSGTVTCPCEKKSCPRGMECSRNQCYPTSFYAKSQAESKAIATKCPGGCDSAQCGPVSVQYTYTDPVTKKVITGTVSCPCAAKSCPAPQECNGNKCDCPAGGAAVDMPCGDGSLGGCSCVSFGSSGNAVDCYKGKCLDSGPCGIDGVIRSALDAYLASGKSEQQAETQKWDYEIQWAGSVEKNHSCGLTALRAKLVAICTDLKVNWKTEFTYLAVKPVEGGPCK